MLVASQLLFSLAADAMRTGGTKLDAPTLVGAAMLAVGAVLVANR